MPTRLTFYNKKIHLTLFLNIHISKRSIHVASWNSLCHHSRGTHVTLPPRITIIKRFMRNSRGHAPKVLNATNKSPVQATATAFPANPNKVEEELEANRKLPTGIDFSNNATDQGSTYTRGHGSSSQNNSGPLGTYNPNHRTTLTTENTQAVPHSHVRGYVTPPPGEGYRVFKFDSTDEPHPTKPGKIKKISKVVDATGQEIPDHVANHMILRDNETGKDVGVLTSNKNPSTGAKPVADHNVENKVDKNGNPIPQNMRVYDEPRSSETASAAKEYPKGTAFAQKYDTIIDKYIVASGITNKVPTKRVDRDAAELYHENGYPIFNVNGREIEYDFNPNVPSPVNKNNDASQPSKMDNTNNNEEK